MKVRGVWELAAPTVHVHGYSAQVTIRQPKLQVKCAPARVPLGNETKCVASVDLPVSPFTVQSWSYSGTAAPAAPAGDVKEWTFKPGEVASGTVTVTALVGTGTQTTTAQVEVVWCDVRRDPLLDTPSVQDSLRQLWARSNYSPGTPPAERSERGAWLVESAGGYAFQPFTDVSISPCGIEIPQDSKPANAVAWVHTHPFAYDEKQTSWEGITIGGTTFYPTYKGTESGDDHLAAGQLGLPGYMLDANHAVKFDHNGQLIGDYPRCGY